MCITRLDIILYFLLVEQFQKHLFHIIEVDEMMLVFVLTILFLPTAGKAENKSCIFTLVGGRLICKRVISFNKSTYLISGFAIQSVLNLLRCDSQFFMILEKFSYI